MSVKLIELSDEQREIIKKQELDTLIIVDQICKKHKLTYWLGYGTLLGCIRHQGFIPWDDDVDICMPRSDFKKFRNICSSELPKDYFYQSHLTEEKYYHFFDKIRINNTVFKESCVSKLNINHGVYIDIFPVDNIDDNKYKIHYYKVRILRAINNARFLNLESRAGKKKLAAIVLRLAFFYLSSDWIWNKAEKIASKYASNKQSRMGCFFSPYGLKDIYDSELLNDFIEREFEGHTFTIPKNYDKLLTQLYGDYMSLPPLENRKTIHDLVELSI